MGTRSATAVRNVPGVDVLRWSPIYLSNASLQTLPISLQTVINFH